MELEPGAVGGVGVAKAKVVVIVESAAAAEASDAAAATVAVMPWWCWRSGLCCWSRCLFCPPLPLLLLLLSGSDSIRPGRNHGSIAPATAHQAPAPAIISCFW